MPSSFSIIDASTMLTVIFTCVMTIANILMWLSMQHTTKVQTASNRSLNYQSLIQGHRDLLFGLINKPDLFSTFAKENKFDADQWAIQIISTFFINHAWVCYMNLEYGTLDQAYLESFKEDVQDMFTWPSVHERWQTCKTLYPESFRKFVEKELRIKAPSQAST